MLVTKEQGIACRKAAEYIADGKWDLWSLGGLPDDEAIWDALCLIEAPISPPIFTLTENFYFYASEVLMALLWCAEIAGEE